MALTTMAMLISLAGTSWAVPDAPKQYVEFKPQKVSGNGGCNYFFGKYNQQKDNLKLGPLASTRKGCDAETMRQEMKFMLHLEQTTSAEILDKKLVFKNAKGDVLLKLSRKI
jgi:heat shock protein HslJ